MSFHALTTVEIFQNDIRHDIPKADSKAVASDVDVARHDLISQITNAETKPVAGCCGDVLTCVPLFACHQFDELVFGGRVALTAACAVRAVM